MSNSIKWDGLPVGTVGELAQMFTGEEKRFEHEAAVFKQATGLDYMPYYHQIGQWAELAERYGIPVDVMLDLKDPERVRSCSQMIRARIIGKCNSAGGEKVAGANAELAGEAKVGGERVTGRLTCRELADQFGVDRESLRKRLDRWRRDHDAGWTERQDVASRESKYLYEFGAVRPIIDALKCRTPRPSNVRRK